MKTIRRFSKNAFGGVTSRLDGKQDFHGTRIRGTQTNPEEDKKRQQIRKNKEKISFQKREDISKDIFQKLLNQISQ